MRNYREAVAAMLVRDLDHMVGHGSYIDEYKNNDATKVFERVLPVTDEMARRMIAEAMLQSGPDVSSQDPCEGAKDLVVEPWMLPLNKCFVVFQAGDHYVHAIYRHDWKTYVVRAKGIDLAYIFDRYNTHSQFRKTIVQLYLGK